MPSLLKKLPQHFSRIRSVALRNFFRRAAGDDPAAGFAAFGSEIDDPIGGLDDFQIMFDHQHGIAGIDEIMQHLEQQFDIGEMQPGGRLIEQIERAAGAFFDQLAGEFHALGLAAGERGRRLPELHVVEAHVVQRLQLVMDAGNVLEMREGLLDIHLQHLGDIFSFEADLQRLAIEAVPIADRAGDPNVGQKIHFEAVRAVSLAGFAAAALDVETEPARLVSLGFRLGHLGIKIANFVEHLDVRRGIAPRRAADGRLVDGDQPVEMLLAVDARVLAGIADAGVQVAVQRLDQNIVHQRAFSGAGNAGHADEGCERESRRRCFSGYYGSRRGQSAAFRRSGGGAREF